MIINDLVKDLKPDELYNFAAISHVHHSFKMPITTTETDSIAPLKILNAIHKYSPKTKFLQSSTSEMFGNADVEIINEETPFNPQSPYAIAKIAAYYTTKFYRHTYGIFAVNVVPFNHESSRRGEEFITRKITLGAARIKHGLQKELQLGNIDSKRDWSHAKDIVRGMWMMLNKLEKPDDYVLATGEVRSVREFCEHAFAHAGYQIKWVGKGVDEKGVDAKTGKTLISINPEFFRPSDVTWLRGDYAKAKRDFGWEPSMKFKGLCEEMQHADLKFVEKLKIAKL